VLKVKFVIVLLTVGLKSLLAFSQENYNACEQALELCPNQIFTINNLQANKTFCPGCEDDFSFCFAPENTIWMSFTTNAAGGDVTLDFSNLQFQTGSGLDNSLNAAIILPLVPCNAPSYTLVGTCVNDAVGPFSLTATGLDPNTTYFVVVSGDLVGVNVTQPGECTFDVVISGTAVDRLISGISISMSDQTLCAQDLLVATASVTNCPDTSTYKWFVNGVLVAETTDPQYLTSEIEDGDIISVEASCFSLCPVIVSAVGNSIEVTTINIDAGADITIDYGDTIQLFGSTDASSFLWSPEFAMSSVNSLNPFVWPLTTTTYTLTATEGDCTLSDQIVVSVIPKLIFPNTFSPNNDGLNDTWQIEGIELYPDCFIRIHDRWGQEVYQSTGYSEEKAWNGENRSGPLSEGVYFYIIDLRDEEKQQFKGSITLIR
jgi:gliding motility-associated-like protein